MVIAGDCGGHGPYYPEAEGRDTSRCTLGSTRAEAIFAALRRGDQPGSLRTRRRWESSVIAVRPPSASRNMRQPFARGFLIGGAVANAMELSGGRLPGGHWRHPRRRRGSVVFIGDRDRSYPKPDGKLTFDKLSSRVRERQRDARRRAQPHPHRALGSPLAVGLMWQHSAPAHVYEVPEAASRASRGPGPAHCPADAIVDVHITPSNCIQCGAITAKGGRVTRPKAGKGRTTRSPDPVARCRDGERS